MPDLLGITLFSLVSFHAQYLVPDKVLAQVKEQVQVQVQVLALAGKMFLCFPFAK
jgi:hypothetical protein